MGIATHLHITIRVLDTNNADSTTGSFGYITSLYKVVDSKDGICYTLRRVERVRTNNDMIVGFKQNESFSHIFVVNNVMM